MPRKGVEGATATWDVGICETCYKAPKHFLCGLFCGPCMIYSQRSRIYRMSGGSLSENYTCCGGIICDDMCGDFGRKCAPLCLCTEIFFCCWCALSGNRWLIQSKYFIQNTCLENTMIWIAVIASWVMLILSFVLPVPQEVDWACDLIYLCFSACLQAQQEAELDVKEKDGAHSVDNQPKRQAMPIVA